MAGINQGNMKDYLGKHVYYTTSWGYNGDGMLRRVLGMGHVEIMEAPDDSIITSIQNVFLTKDARDKAVNGRKRQNYFIGRIA